MSTLTAVLVDDHEVVLEGLRGMLERHGFDVAGTATTIDQAVTATRDATPDLVIIDVRLREASGIDGIERLCAVSPDTAVCILTSYPNVRDARLAMELGATGYLLKDVPIEQLARQLAAVATGAFLIDPRLGQKVLRGGDPILTDQEIAVLALVAEGLTNRQIGDELHLSPHTVKEYLSNSMTKLGTKTRTGTVTVAIREGLLGRHHTG